MVLTHKSMGLVLIGSVAIALAGLAVQRLADAQTPNPIPKDTVFATDAQNTSGTGFVVWRLEAGKDPEVWAKVDPHDDDGQPWLAPLAFGPNGHLYLMSKGNSGTLLDVTKKGDLTADKPLATNIFAEQPTKMVAMVFDTAGNAYITNSEVGRQPIAKVDPSTGKVSTLNGDYDGPRGLAIRKDANNKEILYIVEGATGNVLTYNLTDNTPGDKPFATGFPGQADHQGGSLAFDPRGRLMLHWRMDPDDEHSGGVFDITAGGDFKDFAKNPPLVLTPMRMDVNKMSIDSKNNIYLGGDNTNVTWVSTFDAATGKFSDFVELTPATQGEAETTAVAP
jgi:glucose/arabinose dehydrogenase